VARAAGLRYVTDEKPGITRIRTREGFAYVSTTGDPIDDEATLARIKALVIPPAWEDVWISPSGDGHLQATGRDARGRKQYRYHASWRAIRDEAKYDRMLDFARALPVIRERTDRDLSRPGLPRDKVLATVVRLLEITLIRIGNEEYARENNSFGLTTLRNRHVDVSGSTLRFKFRGKHGKQHEVGIRNRKLANVVKRLQELPGQDLFQYIDDDGQTQTIESSDVNQYLRDITGRDFTAKDFRTWGGTILAALALRELGGFETEAEAKHRILRAVEFVSRKLGNTPAICRKCYIHPAVFDAYRDGSLEGALKRNGGSPADELDNLTDEETSVVRLLRKRLKETNAA
jgi:DNA topoisomerase-1